MHTHTHTRTHTHTHTHTLQKNIIIFTITWHSTVVKTVLDSRWQIKKVRKRGGEWQECRNGGFLGKLHFLVCMLILLGWNVITDNVGPLHRRKDLSNSLWLPSIYHQCIDCHWKEYIALKSRCYNRIDLISINFHLEFDIFFISEQHKLFKEDAGVANFLSHP